MNQDVLGDISEGAMSSLVGWLKWQIYNNLLHYFVVSNQLWCSMISNLTVNKWAQNNVFCNYAENIPIKQGTRWGSTSMDGNILALKCLRILALKCLRI